MEKTFRWALVVFTLLFTLIPMTAVYVGEKKRKRQEAKVAAAYRLAEVTPIANEWVVVPPGAFIMGSDDGSFDEKPARQVVIDGFFIQRYEVTLHDYMTFVETTSHRSPLTVRDNAIRPHFNHPNNPAVYVSWHDAEVYCRWIGARLPSEAEWEKAARGIRGRKWPWGDSPGESNANFIGEDDLYRYPAPVGTFQRDVSPYGVYDMAGNAREWVADWYDERYYRSAPDENPTGPADGEVKVLRGGSWNDSDILGRSAGRLKMFPEYRDVSIGFRCAKGIREDQANIKE